MSAAEVPDELCTQCGHSFNDHEVKSIADPPLWGWIVCPVDDCDCWSTWAVNDLYTRPEVEEMLAKWVEETGLPLT